MASRILVPLDGTPLGKRALAVAVNLARGSGGTLHLVRIHVPPTRAPISLEGMPVVDRDEDLRCWEREREYMTRIRQGLGPRSELATRIALLNGPVEEVLVTYAALHRIDLNIASVDAPTMTGTISTQRTAMNVSGADQDFKVLTEAPAKASRT